MGLRWKAPSMGQAPMDGVQFHPESFLSDPGARNWLPTSWAVNPDSMPGELECVDHA